MEYYTGTEDRPLGGADGITADFRTRYYTDASGGGHNYHAVRNVELYLGDTALQELTT